MTETVYKISDVSSTVGVPPATLRLWEQHGLVHPIRTESGYRLFREEDVARVREILRLRSIHGLNLAAIRSALGDSDSPPEPHHTATPGLGPALRKLRRKQNLTIRQVADAVGVSSSVISTLERTSSGVGIRLMKTLAETLGTTVTDLIAEEVPPTHAVVRSGEGRLLPMLGAGIKILELASGPRMMDCQEWTLLPGAGSEGFYSHEGEEFIRVLEGRFEIEVDGIGAVDLNPGDSLYFESRRAHAWRCIGSQTCRLIWVNTPPTF